MAMNKALLGKEYPPIEYKVEPGATEAYAKAYNDDIPAFLGEGAVAPPMYGVVPIFPALGHAIFDQELNVNVMRLVHGEQEMNFIRPIHAGDTITTTASIKDILEKSTGEILAVRLLAKNQKGEEVVDAVMTSFIRGKSTGEKKPEEKAAPPPSPPERKVAFTQEMKVTEDQSLRYAKASGDQNPIHQDKNAAQMAGLPDIILHGLCTMAFAQKAVLDEYCDRDPSRLKRLKVRFSKPVFNGETLTTSGWVVEEKGDTVLLGLETKNQDGVVVLKDAVAEVTR